MSIYRVAILFVVGALFTLNIAVAQEGRQRQTISLTLANEAAKAAVGSCLAKGRTVSAAVVDQWGQLIALQRADGASPYTVDSSNRKAYEAVTTGHNTGKLLNNMLTHPGIANPPVLHGILIVGGGVPIREGGEVIGAIGISGAPGGEMDDRCAEAGRDRIHDRLARLSTASMKVGVPGQK